ncbi:MAG: sugar phosphate isomerase/epimerase, partial [Vicinamibacterales bacterium]
MITRRIFLQQAGALASGALVFPVSQPRRRYKLGLQLFTMRAALKADVEGTLKRVAGMGYEEFETYGFDPEGIRYYGLPAKAFGQM